MNQFKKALTPPETLWDDRGGAGVDQDRPEGGCMMRSRGLSLLIAAGGLLLWAGGPAAAGNPYGVHTFLQDHMTDTAVQSHLAWSRRLTRPGGHVKQLIYPILNNTPGPQASWVNFVSACYQRQLVPVLRIATMMQNGAWVKPTPDAPGDYTSFANAVKRVIQGLPLDPVLPLYVEVLNETNNNGEWSWQANPTEYAHVLEDVAVALHAIGPRVKVLNGALSPGGDYDNLLYIRAMFAAVPTLGNHLDGWASHTYSGDPPERNNHNGNAVNPRSAIDAYTTELAVLADYMPVANLKVIITEMDFVGVDEVERAARMMRAFRDFWSQWPEIMAVCPWYFCNPLSNGQGPDWVYPMSGTLPDGYPTMPKPIYDAVAALAKPGDANGAVSGTVTESAFGAVLGGVTVVCQPGGRTTTSDAGGTYYLAELPPGSYSLEFSRAGFETHTRAGVSVSAAINTVVDPVLVAAGTGTVTGTVTDPLTGTPLAGVTVSTSPGAYAAVSSGDGTYTLANLPPATYAVTASRRGRYSHQRENVVVEVGVVRTLHFSPGADDFPEPSLVMFGGREVDDEGTIAGVARGWTNLDGSNKPQWFAVDPVVRYSGHGAQRITAGSTSGYDHVWNITNYSAVTAGQTYLGEVWCRTAGLVRGSARGATLCLRFFSNDMQLKGEYWSYMALEGTTDWTRIHRIAVAPTGSGRMQILLVAGGTSGTAWFDNAWFGPANFATVNAPAGTVMAGQNLLSLPLRPSRPDVGTLYSRCGSMDDRVRIYDPAAGYLVFPADFTWLFTGSGHWLDSPSACAMSVSGAGHPREQYVRLNNGWTLIGVPFDSERFLRACEVMSGGIAHPLAEAPADWLNPTLLGWTAQNGHRRLRADGTGDDDRLRPWQGCWVRGFRNDLTLVIPQGMSAPPPPTPPPTASRVSLTLNAAGCAPWTFRAGLAPAADSGLDGRDACAPPAPPTGVPEVRCTTDVGAFDRLADDFRAPPATGTAAAWNLRISGVNFDPGQCRTAAVTWNLADAGDYAWRLVDRQAATIVYLDPGGSATLEVCDQAESVRELQALAGGFNLDDFDADGDYDQNDFDAFLACATGPGVPYDPQQLPPACTLTPDPGGIIAADFDRDGDVDQADFGAFQRCYGGPWIPAARGCAD